MKAWPAPNIPVVVMSGGARPLMMISVQHAADRSGEPAALGRGFELGCGLPLRREPGREQMPVPDATTLDAGGKLAVNLLSKLGCDLMAEEGGHVFGFYRQCALRKNLFIERLEDGLRERPLLKSESVPTKIGCSCSLTEW
jgi:hypothetical protein